ncbi:uncharacterized protein BJX67DRAFT_199279 [Aspergillus lucknowensis]|uniref:Uncharacterized protein n=1 Tax=Aspergillus lucknowensis TaxID=176173 RepID=A0ABR4LJT4_9EURO
MPAPQIHSTFSVTSGGLCFGYIAEIDEGASSAIQPFPNVRPRLRDTELVHDVEYNVAAENGTWNVYQLIDRRVGCISGWFACHSPIVDDPCREVDRILRVAGAPYEADSGSAMNSDTTAAEGIFVISPGDWFSSKRSTRDRARELGCSPSHWSKNTSRQYLDERAVGLVDYGKAKSQVHAWQTQNSELRGGAIVAESGIWMTIPHVWDADSRPDFGRFGFDEARTAARSFLFFTERTDFTETLFRGIDQRVFRKRESHEERFARRLREGYDFSGIEHLNERHAPSQAEWDLEDQRLYPLRPPEEEWLGPYDRREYLLLPEELVGLFRQRPIVPYLPMEPTAEQGVMFVEPWRESVCDLLNELILSYLEKVVLKVLRSHPTMSSAALFAADLFPHHQHLKHSLRSDRMMYEYFLRAAPMEGSESPPVVERIVAFFNSRLGMKMEMEVMEVMERLGAVASLLATILLYSARRHARNCRRDAIMPSDTRVTVPVADDGIFEKLQYSRVFWGPSK